MRVNPFFGSTEEALAIVVMYFEDAVGARIVELIMNADDDDDDLEINRDDSDCDGDSENNADTDTGDDCGVPEDMMIVPV